MDNNNKKQLSAVLVDGTVTSATVLIRAAARALKMARQEPWALGDRKRFTIKVGKEFLSFDVTFE